MKLFGKFDVGKILPGRNTRNLTGNYRFIATGVTHTVVIIGLKLLFPKKVSNPLMYFNANVYYQHLSELISGPSTNI